jgi:PPOX class probable F420-dependent enzyme
MAASFESPPTGSLPSGLIEVRKTALTSVPAKQLSSWNFSATVRLSHRFQFWLRSSESCCNLGSPLIKYDLSYHQGVETAPTLERYPFAPVETLRTLYNIRMASVPAEIHGQRYISLATFRKNGAAVYTPIWFVEDNSKLYFMTNSKLGKCKRIHNNPNVKIAPCTIRGKITGPESSGTVRVLRPEEFERVRQAIKQKYWLARIPFLWRNTDTYMEITPV